ncbi:acylphosphatase [Tranquillimonas alkanivorans]|uniref:Acylphosphatase n=1 Tax=Tranquillimonas alkanivorans TaxID=441119 RepID=A0A1I5SYE0_9RHOB|nr:acylphosphatase [Tranquillimonas alkanivorans]SFP75718.1 acylphosphatase [Tranquillimonas alkanivorans]
MSERVAVEVRVTGRVQGVSFRAWTQGEAEELGLAGWVRNADDGAVEAWLEGPEDAVRAMVERLNQGPLPARVDTVEEVSRGTPEGESSFRITG